jgi:hypothetical protein
MESQVNGPQAVQTKMEPLNQTTNSMSKPERHWLFPLGLILIVVIRAVFSLPWELSFHNFAFMDLGGFQHVDRLIGQGLRPGVDFGYTYGLLPLLIQHLYFAAFGMSHWPTLAMLALYVLSMLVFWALLTREIGQTWVTFGILLGLSEMMIFFVPWPPTLAHMLMKISIAFSLYFMMKQRLSLALSVAALGALAVPSLPIVLTGIIALIIAWEWWQKPGRTLLRLVAQIAPAVAAYGGCVLLMTAFFGWRSVLQSLVPTGGAKLYRAMNFGIFGQGLYFLHPPGANLSYYLLTPAGMWIVCSGLLVVFGCLAALRIARTSSLTGIPLLVVVCCALHLIFVFAAYGNAFSYELFSFFLAAGIVAGISSLTDRRLKIAVSSLLLIFGLLSQVGEIKDALQLWKTESTSPETAFLYAPNDFQPEWKSVLSMSKNRRVFLLSYGMGVDAYYPEIGTPNSWLLLPGLPLPREDAYVLQQIRAADVVVEETEVTTRYIKNNKEWQAALLDFPVKVSGRYFRIWARDPAVASELIKTADFHSN